jgi:hypothetical protein
VLILLPVVPDVVVAIRTCERFLHDYCLGTSLVVLALLAAPTGVAIAATTTAPALYKNCTNLNKRYPHGLGRLAARDHTSGTPVTNFKRSTKLYRLAMS